MTHTVRMNIGGEQASRERVNHRSFIIRGIKGVRPHHTLWLLRNNSRCSDFLVVHTLTARLLFSDVKWTGGLSFALS
jgi:hypothetical protein